MGCKGLKLKLRNQKSSWDWTISTPPWQSPKLMAEIIVQWKNLPATPIRVLVHQTRERCKKWACVQVCQKSRGAVYEEGCQMWQSRHSISFEGYKQGANSVGSKLHAPSMCMRARFIHQWMQDHPWRTRWLEKTVVLQGARTSSSSKEVW